MTNYRNAVEELTSRGSERKEPSLEGTKGALEQLDHPENNYKVVLVGGTNGKGSTCEMISELLQSQGYSVGVYRSPHLVTVRERITVDREMISEEEFLELYNSINELNSNLTFFEFTTVMAYQYFADRDVEYAIMEVGMGGRLDATNAVKHGTAVITNVGLDHTEYLGDTREEIAYEKAGIIPENGVLVTGVELEPILNTADERNTRIVKPSKVSKNGDIYTFRDHEFTIPVKGEFQKYNLGSALATVQTLTSIPKDLTSALSHLNCPGRMEQVSTNPLVIHDGAHNPDALEQTIEDLPDDFICVFNATRTKNIPAMIEILERKASKFILTNGPVDWSEKPENIAEYTSIETEIVPDPHTAIEQAVEQAGPEGSVVVTGSLYLLGSIRSCT